YNSVMVHCHAFYFKQLLSHNSFAVKPTTISKNIPSNQGSAQSSPNWIVVIDHFMTVNQGI
ncbi:MAG: hypothetical protein ACTHKP_09175, partial [Nitrososphaeraceae archaeon]